MSARAGDAPERPPSHRLRFAVGLLVASALAVGVGYRLLDGALAQGARSAEDRRANVAIRALAEVVDRAGVTGDAVRAAVAAWAKDHPQQAAIKVVAFDGLSLEASTDPADTGDEAAPRRLRREEKDLYDRGQRLRAAVETNRAEGASRKDEVERARLADGSLSIAAPLEKDGAVVGLVQVQRRPPPPVKPPSWLTALSYVAVPVAVFLLAGLVVGERRAVLGVLAVVLLAGTVWGYGAQSAAKLERGRRAVEEGIAGIVRDEGAKASAILASLSLPAEPPLDPARWDADAFRRPYGVVRSDGSVDEAKVAASAARDRTAVRNALLLVGGVSLAVLLFVGLGGASAFVRTVRTNRVAYTYVLPAMAGMVVLVFFPFLYGIAISFTDSTIYNTNAPLTDIWVGFKNYVSILSDFHVATRDADGTLVFNYLNFYWTLWVTVAWTVTNVTIGVTVGLFLALVLNTKGLALKPVYRVLLILPWAMPNYITALIWKGMFHQQFGVVNQVIQIFGGSPVSWFETPFTSFLTALATNGWLSFPFMMVVSLGALQSIPSDLYEAARVDGASRWQQFTGITLPSLKPALVPAIILSVVWTFNMFNIIYLVTQGEPGGSTEILITQAYKFAFEKYRYGYAAAYSTVIFGILVVYGTFQNRVTRATEGI